MSNENEEPKLLGIPPWLGFAVMAAGILLVVWGPRHISPREWIWWTGVVLTGLGVILWFYSGMTRAQAVDWTKSLLLALAVALVFRWSVGEPYKIPSGSMEPTLQGDDRIGRGDRVFVNKWLYGVRYPLMNKRIWYGREPQRWELVVFKSAEEDPMHSTLVKRIVGMPGEHIQIRDGRVYADGVALEYPEEMPPGHRYTSAGMDMRYGVLPQDEYANVPEGNYLLLGDNSPHSRDGRHAGWVPNENMVGRVAAVWWPPRNWTDFTGFSETLWWRALVTLIIAWTFVRLFIGRFWTISRREGKGYEHQFVSFLHLGLRIPFTRWWLIQWGRCARGEVVLYHPPANDKLPEDVVLLGRIAGLPGEKVQLQNGKLTVDGRPPEDAPPLVQADYPANGADAVFGRSRNKEHCQVPEDHYYILADSHHESEGCDSRALGWVPRRHIAGKAAWIVWPPAQWGRVQE